MRYYGLINLFHSKYFNLYFKFRKKPGTMVSLSEQEIRTLIYKSREIFINQPILLELEAPITILGK